MAFFSKKINPDMVKMINPTSKASLKTQCLIVSQCDIEQANRLYDYFTKDMPDLPPFDTPDPTFADKTKNTLSSLFSFFGDHKDGLSQGYEIFRNLLNARGANLPPLGEVAEDVAEAENDLPPIE